MASMSSQDFSALSECLFPNVSDTPETLEQRYPPRKLAEGEKVTRFSPSPTGFVHFGGMYQVMVGERIAHTSNGIFYLRIEDTDAKREVKNAAQGLIHTLSKYGVTFDEGACIGQDGTIADNGIYGPYKQSLRADIYHVYAKELVKRGYAYPVFSTEEALADALQADKKTENQNKDWEAEAENRRAQTAKNRSITLAEAQSALAAGQKFVLRLYANGEADRKFQFTDLVKGKLELPENDEDFVLLKSDGIPTYHFAHVVDDHLMGTTHVIRGEEWLPSLPKHLMLFRYLDLKPPKYLHTAQVLRMDENGNKKKLSKRDMGAKMEDYVGMGYAPASVIEYLMTLTNSNYEEWHAQNPDKAYTAFPFSIKKLSPSGCLFDFQKLNDVSKNVMAHMTAAQVYDGLLCWASEFAPAFADKLTHDPAYAKQILSIGRGGKKPRKDYGTYQEAMDYMALFYDDSFRISDVIDSKFDSSDILSALAQFRAQYAASDDQNAWFEKIKAIAASLGYAADMKEYKSNPEAFRGNVGDVSMFLRIAVTGKLASPDLYEVMQILGSKCVLNRIAALEEKLK